MKKITIVSATMLSEADFWEKSVLGPNLKRHFDIGNVDNFIINYQNKDGLSTVYNRFITEEYRDNIVVFVHDDVHIYDLDLKQTLNTAHKEYAVVGVAGTTALHQRKPIVWHNSMHFDKDFREKIAGCVYHTTSHNTEQANFFGAMPRGVVVIDGLFMSVDMNILLDSQCRFNEKFTFHFYDIAFSLNCKMKGLSIGVWNIPMLHHSHGDYNTLSWQQMQEIFIKEYKGT